MSFKSKKLIIFVIFFLIFLFPSFSQADEYGEKRIFNVDQNYDALGRERIFAILVKVSQNAYFYIDEDYWGRLSSLKKEEVANYLRNLAQEFDTKIYPTLTFYFGSEPKPGIDKDERITVLIHPIISDGGGYFNSGDVYSRFQNPKSNEREMVYLNSQYIDKPKVKSFLAHEFMHLITVNQKDLLRKVTEEIWLNEARAEYAPTLLGYDDIYKGSNLETRVKDFLEDPTVSLTEWLDKKEDYGAVNLFIQYLVDHYGKKILVDSLQSSKTGIESLNYALEKNGFAKNFSQIFADWLITLLVNDCKVGERYCYLNKNLKDLRIVPTFYYLPRTETILSTYHLTPPWNLNWQRFIGGGSEVSLKFDGADSVEFEVPYLLCDFQNVCSVGFLVLDAEQKGELLLSQFNVKYSSLTTLPFIKSKICGFNGKEDSFSFSWKVTVEEKTQTELKNQLLARIAELQAEVDQLQAQLAALLAKRSQQGATPCRFENNLYYGIMNNSEVRCLQEFLKTQGIDIYPEGLVTGNFLSLTKLAVIRFQEKYTSEILVPLGLKRGTGYVGERTRAKIKQLINF
ncbi:MAG: peptidoglycan-binding domain-containing protein [Patescibacteria group bacterium]|nr:peptidoglycan-binding domain-containing protein [Patescibacteria group bacterium]